GFADYLLSLGMKTRVDERPEGWDVWIYNEDHIQQARDELRSFLNHPDDPRYRDATPPAAAVRRNERQLEKKFVSSEREASDIWGCPALSRRPLTTAMIVACIVIFIWEKSLPPGRFQAIPSGDDVARWLLFSSYTEDHGLIRGFGLDDIRHGQVWRLV